MTAQESSPQTAQYRCPDEERPIGRAVHLGRLAAFYPACRQCPHREDTGTLSPRQVAQLAEIGGQGRPPSIFSDEGAGGVYLNDLTPAAARDIAAAFGVLLRGEGRGEKGEGRAGKGERRRESEEPSVHHSSFIIHHSSNPQSPIPNPSVVLAWDGRALTAELVAAAGEGLRFSGCDVIDVGPATAACLALAIDHFRACGGILVGNPGQEPHRVGMKFWTAGPRPLSAGGSLEPLVELVKAGVSRPARHFGVIRRLQADGPYLARMAQYYHAIRPLRVVVDSASKPLVGYLERLAATVACEIIPSRSVRHDLPGQVRANAAHFAVCIDGDGETCGVLDERGHEIPAERLLLLLARNVGGDSSRRSVVLETGSSRTLIERLEGLGMRVAMSSPRRADLSAAMSENGALLGGGPSGRFWFNDAGFPSPDALMTVTRLLVLLSRSDEPLSAVLDREAAGV